jgi:ACS family hexuronate transporter-like MFS transporter
MAQGLTGFRVFRFLLGCGESANWPGATKAVSEWFPAKERAWAVALFDSGSSVGGAVAPFLVLFLYKAFGSWRPAFLLIGTLGLLWLVVWRMVYRSPETHPRISAAELEYIQMGRAPAPAEKGGLATRPPGLGKLLRYKQVWGIMLGRGLLDPYWFMMSEWFALYLMSKGFRLEQSVLGFWAPFLSADLGNFCGGAISSYWISRGWKVGRSRRTVLLIFGPSMILLIPAAFLTNYVALILLFSWTTFAYGACSTMFLSMPADVFHSRSVATVSGMSGTCAGIGTLISTYLIGRITDRFSFQPIIITASIIPSIATLLLVLLVKKGREPDPEQVLLDF